MTTGKKGLVLKSRYHAQTEGIYVSRAFGSDSHYRAAYVDTDAGTVTGKETGKGSDLSVEPETMGHLLCHVCAG